MQTPYDVDLLGCKSSWIQTPSPLDADSPRCRSPGGRTPPPGCRLPSLQCRPLPPEYSPSPSGCRMSGRRFSKHFLPLRSVIRFTVLHSNFHFSVIRSFRVPSKPVLKNVLLSTLLLWISLTRLVAMQLKQQTMATVGLPLATLLNPPVQPK